MCNDFTTVGDGTKNLTRFQLPVYNCIVDITLIYGVPPTMRVIAHTLNMSYSTVHHHFHKIMEQGLIERAADRKGYRIAGMTREMDYSAPLYKEKQ